MISYLLGTGLPSFIKIREDTGEVYLFVYVGKRNVPGVEMRTEYVVLRLAQMPENRSSEKGFEQITERGRNLIAFDSNGEPRNYGRIVERFDLRVERNQNEKSVELLNSIFIAGGTVRRVIEREGKFFFEYWGVLPNRCRFFEAAGISDIISSEFIELFDEASGKEPARLGPFGKAIFMNEVCLMPYKRRNRQKTLGEITGVRTEEVIPSSR
jgi:hypothetical protein